MKEFIQMLGGPEKTITFCQAAKFVLSASLLIGVCYGVQIINALMRVNRTGRK